MKDIDDKSVDLIVIDPPYNIGKDTWDKIENYIEWMGLVFKECERVLKDNGSFYFFHNNMMTIVELIIWLKIHSKFIFKSIITWNKIDEDFKNIGFVQQRLSIDMMRNYYSGFTEYILYYTFQDSTGLEEITKKYIKPKNPFSIYLREEFKRAGVINKNIAQLFPSKTGGLTGCVSNWLNGDNVITEDQYLKIRDYLNNQNEFLYLRKEYEDLRKEYEDLRYPFNVSNVKQDLRANSNVWLYPPASQNGHITPKPVELIENIIKHSSNKGDIVLDCFMGSGTVAIACLNTNRKYIGIEKEGKYFNIANDRINQLTIKNT